MARSIDFRVVAYDEASRDFRKIGDEALRMAAEVRAADAVMADQHSRTALKNHQLATSFHNMARSVEKDSHLASNEVTRGWRRIVKANDNLDRSILRMWHRSNGWTKALLLALPLIPPLANAAAVAVGSLVSVVASAGPGMGVLFGGLALNYKSFLQSQEKGNKNPTFSQLPVIQDFAKATKSASFGVFNAGIRLLTSLLPKLVPIFNTFAGVFTRFLNTTNRGMQSAGFSKFLAWVRTVGAANFGNLLRAIRNIAVGLGNIGMAFTGPGLKFTRWLDEVTKKFDTWSAHLRGSSGFKSFMQFFHQNGPLLADTAKQIAIAIGHLVTAMAPLSHITLSSLDHLLRWFNSLSPHQIDVIVRSLIALKIAISGVKIASAGFNLLRTIGIVGGEGAAGAGGAAAGGVLGPIALVTAAVAGYFLVLKKGNAYASKHSTFYRHEHQLEINELHKLTTETGKYFNSFIRWANQAAPSGRAFWMGFFHVAGFALGAVVAKLAGLMHQWAQWLRALSHVPGLGWLKNIANGLDNASRKAYGFARALAGIHSKTVTIRTNFVETHTIHTVRSGPGGGTRQGQAIYSRSGFATGGRPPVGKASWVGEQGPELFIPDTPGRIATHHESKQMAAGGGGDLAKALAKALDGATIKLVDGDGVARRAYLQTGRNI